MACGDRAGVAAGAGAGVPMVTLVTDWHYGDGRVPYELHLEERTPIWMAKQAVFDSLDGF